MTEDGYFPELRCGVSPQDRLRVGVYHSLAGIAFAKRNEAFTAVDTLFLNAADVRRLRKQLKKALRKLERRTEA